MRWKGRQGSKNIEDRRRGGGVGRKLGLGTVLIVLLALLLGENPMQFLQQMDSGAAPVQSDAAPRDELAQFVSVVLKDTEDVWGKLFREELNLAYEPPVLVLYSGQVQSACGFSSSASGPFYCPGDKKLYIDLSFYEDLKNRFEAPGDFAMAYVVAHEVAHHVQNLLGITAEVFGWKRQLSEKEFNCKMVSLELQADFFAGVWAHHAQKMKNILEEGDIEEALNAAFAIGDDRLQMKARGYVVPDSFTHGTSEQRMHWFAKGLKTGDIRQGDTFSPQAR